MITFQHCLFVIIQRLPTMGLFRFCSHLLTPIWLDCSQKVIKSNQINCKTFTWKHFNENIVYALRYLISNVFFLRLYPLLVRSRLLKWSNVSKTGGFCKSACVWWPWKWSVGKAWCLKLRTAWPTSTLARSSPQHLRTRESESENVTSFLSPSGSGSGTLTLGNNWHI